MKRGMFTRNLSFSEFYCTQCGSRSFDIPRVVGKERKGGHLKKIFCLTCQKEINHVECKPNTKYDVNAFLEEWHCGNFDVDGNRIYEYGEFRKRLNNGKYSCLSAG